jgi:hypothetical protein
MPIQVQEASRTQNRHDQNRTSPQHIIIKTISKENKEGILKVIREKSNSILRKTHQNNSTLLNRMLKSKKGMERGMSV